MTNGDVVAELVDNYAWSKETLDVWRRAEFHCEYCGADLLRSVDEHFYNAELDHIVPSSKGGDSKDENLALSCRTCNRLKRNKEFGPVAEGQDPRSLIDEIGRFVRRKRTEKQSELAKVRELLEKLG